MKYEIDFIGINEESKNADAICFRYFNEYDNRYHIGIYDGGTKSYGIKMKNHITKYYKQKDKKLIIDFVICSHPHLDHAPGLVEILNEFEVKKVYINRPWLHINELFEKVKDRRTTKHSLEEYLKNNYKYVIDIEKVCEEKNIKIEDAFEGTIIDNRITVLSPTKEFYIEMLAESEKTPLMENECLDADNNAKIFEQENMIPETWETESLKEEVTTEPDNETSVIIYGDMKEEKFLLVGDAGIKAISSAIEYTKKLGINCKEIKLYQIPHHGGRHNVSTSLLDKLLGNVKIDKKQDGRIAIASVSKNSNHPKRMVTNAFERRGLKVLKTAGETIRHKHNMPDREGWSKVEEVPFYKEVESWDK